MLGRYSDFFCTPQKKHDNLEENKRSFFLELTQEQREIVESKSRIVLVNAYAGTGKTSTLVEYCKARKDKKMLYLAYNSSMAKEARKKFSGLKNVFCTTIHSLAYSKLGDEIKAYKKRIGKASLTAVDTHKYFLNTKYPYFFGNLLLKLLKKFINSEYTIEEVLKQCNDEERKIADYLPKLWADILTNEDMPFEHDFYLKLYQLSRPDLSEFEYILVDEAQDLNPVMYDIVYKQTAIRVFIGDTYQKIYGFRNCINALELLKDNPASEIFFLTQTFRCPSYIVKDANPYLFLLKAQKPLVGKEILFDKNVLQKAHKECIICRTNARVFDYVVSNSHIKFHFVGGTEGYNFNDILDIALLHSKNLEYRRFIKNKFYANFMDHKELALHIKESNDVEAKTRLMIFYKYCKVCNLFKTIKGIKQYSVSEADFIITSAHKSKGLEWDYVRIEDDFYSIKERYKEAMEKPNFPLPIKVPKEELNLLYVAITRAKKYVDIPEQYLVGNEMSEISKAIILVEE
ncbi:ATP-dependent helicase [Helicobacter sp. MIT 00-7814]|uniref:UvrD-helicase domain-containing protein n=1 Tax=unclassified Helicobacter TaxID=2593540 RepID=UPI000E1F93AB|nr:MULTISPECIES: UvrD-helicase domain-containing protein [unclassified Helicobacter]RDU55057.1 ATP-dependent helicase [Helicobacter sp. MIT 99-10781]RDU56876.1 ATP-dependent helicase [Helicobacter sp. MIT 00-7814]